MRRVLIQTAAMIVLLLCGAGAARVYTSAGAPAQDGILPALLTEVRGLRAAMEQMAAAGPRVQLALGRLQLQEQRVNTLVRRLDETRAALSAARERVAQHEDQSKMFEAITKEGSAEGRQAAEQIQHMFAGSKRQMEQANADLQRLTAEEAVLLADIATEQGRWAEINQRVEELEQALGRR